MLASYDIYCDWSCKEINFLQACKTKLCPRGDWKKTVKKVTEDKGDSWDKEIRGKLTSEKGRSHRSHVLGCASDWRHSIFKISPSASDRIFNSHLTQISDHSWPGSAVQSGSPRLDSTRLDSTRFDSTRLDSARFDLTRLDSTRFGAVRLIAIRRDARMICLWQDRVVNATRSSVDQSNRLNWSALEVDGAATSITLHHCGDVPIERKSSGNTRYNKYSKNVLKYIKWKCAEIFEYNMHAILSCDIALISL